MNLRKRIIVTVFYKRRKRRSNETIVSAKFPGLGMICFRQFGVHKLHQFIALNATSFDLEGISSGFKHYCFIFDEFEGN